MRIASVLLFLLQPALIRTGRSDVHVRTGAIVPFLALTVAAMAIPVGLYVVERDLAAGLGPTAASSLLGVVTAMTAFVALVAGGVAFRSRLPSTND